jgi:hypothetical protein
MVKYFRYGCKEAVIIKLVKSGPVGCDALLKVPVCGEPQLVWLAYCSAHVLERFLKKMSMPCGVKFWENVEWIFFGKKQIKAWQSETCPSMWHSVPQNKSAKLCYGSGNMNISNRTYFAFWIRNNLKTTTCMYANCIQFIWCIKITENMNSTLNPIIP